MKLICAYRYITVALFTIALAVFYIPVLAGEIGLSGSIDKTEMAYEDFVNLTLEVKWQGVITDYSFDIMPRPQAQNLKVVGTSSTISSTVENGVDYTTRTFKYSLKPTGFGTGTISPVTFKYFTMPDSIPGELTTQQFEVKIDKPLPPPEESDNTLLIIIMAVVVFVAAGVIVFVIWRKKKSQVVPEKSAEEIVREQLELLRKESQGDRKTFFIRFYKLIIFYLENKYGLSVSGRTTRVILESMEEADIPMNRKEILINWLKMAEVEKFSPSKGEPGDIMRLITAVENFFKEIDNSDKLEAK